MILLAAGLNGLQLLDVQQHGPLVDHLLKMPQVQHYRLPSAQVPSRSAPPALVVWEQAGAFVEPCG